MARIGFRNLNVFMALTCAVGMLVSAVGSQSIPLLITGWSLVLIGFAVSQVVLLDAVPLTVPDSWGSSAQGLFNLTFVVGAGFGAAMAGALAETTSPALTLAILSVLPLIGAMLSTRFSTSTSAIRS
jgi:predicted MFS family arabinose efflux permease